MANRDWHIGARHAWGPLPHDAHDADEAPESSGTSEDPYEILGVSRHAPAEVVRAAYRAMAAKHHPDRNAGVRGAELDLKRINEAFRILTDPAERMRHDAREIPRPAPSVAPVAARVERRAPGLGWLVQLAGWGVAVTVVCAAFVAVGPEACDTGTRDAGSAFARTCAATAINHPRTMRALATTAGADPSDCQLSSGSCVCTWQFHEARGTRKVVGTARFDDGAEDPELPGPERVSRCLASPGAMLKVQLGDDQPISLRSE